MRRWFGYGWAQPVVRRRWALAATVIHWAARRTRWRFGGGPAAHHAWERACGLT